MAPSRRGALPRLAAPPPLLSGLAGHNSLQCAASAINTSNIASPRTSPSPFLSDCAVSLAPPAPAGHPQQAQHGPPRDVSSPPSPARPPPSLFLPACLSLSLSHSPPAGPARPATSLSVSLSAATAVGPSVPPPLAWLHAARRLRGSGPLTAGLRGTAWGRPPRPAPSLATTVLPGVGGPRCVRGAGDVSGRAAPPPLPASPPGSVHYSRINIPRRKHCRD